MGGPRNDIWIRGYLVCLVCLFCSSIIRLHLDAVVLLGSMNFRVGSLASLHQSLWASWDVLGNGNTLDVPTYCGPGWLLVYGQTSRQIQMRHPPSSVLCGLFNHFNKLSLFSVLWKMVNVCRPTLAQWNALIFSEVGNQKFWEARFCQRREFRLFIYLCKWEGLEAEGNKQSSVERDDLHILVGSVHSYINQGKTMIPLSVIFSYFSAYPFLGGKEKNKKLKSGNTLILWCGFKFCLLTHKKIVKSRT